jgi:hypothetical protein
VRATAERLAAALADLPVVIDDAACGSRSVLVPSYGGPRPTSIVRLAGAGRFGEGEHVGFTEDAHAGFARTLDRWDLGGSWRIATLAHTMRERGLHPYDRAAIEMAAVELALRQRATTLGTLAGVVPRPVRTVVSFGRLPDPAAEAARHPDVSLKIDVDPAWPDAVWRALAAIGRVEILDWKGIGDEAAYDRALRWLPDVLHEDPAEPYPAEIAQAVAVDAPITEPAALDALAPVACNLKPARMGSLLDTLRTAARCARREIAIYVGGMFEIGVGRRQLRDLASVLCPDAPNDLAPVPLAEGTTTP